MKINLLTIAALTLVLAAANALAQFDRTLKPVFPGNAITITNTNAVAGVGVHRGIIVGNATNGWMTNGVGQGAPGLNNGVDSGEGKGTPPGARPVPGVGAAPSVGEAPSVGAAPSVGEAPKIRN